MEQALVFASIVLGVAIASELNNLHRLLQSDKVTWHWAQPAFALVTVMSIMSFWWLLARSDLEQEITLAGFLPAMWVMVIFNLIAAAAFPDTIPEEGIDLADYYQKKQRYLWGLYLLAVVPLAGNWIVFSALNADGLGEFAQMAVGEAAAVGLVIWLFFARAWWKVALGFVVYGGVAATWLFRSI